MPEYRRYCNKCTDFDGNPIIKCGCSHEIKIGEYYQSDGKTNLCNECYHKFQKDIYKKQTEKINVLHDHCPFCGKFISILFNYHGGCEYGGQGSGIVCPECGRDFYIELDVRQHVSPLNE